MKPGDAVARDQALLAQADALRIPWQAILADEIVAETTLQRGLAESPAEWPLGCAFYLLPNSLLQSWRVRDRLVRLAWEATAEHSREAALQLRSLYLHLTGKPSQRPPVDFLMASHLWLGYRRVLELRNVARAANRSRGHRAARVECVVGKTRCAPSDAEWAVDRADSRQRSHTLDEAMRRAREEGFELPHGRSEPDAFLRLRRFLQRRGFLPARRGRPPSQTKHFGTGNSPGGPQPLPGREAHRALDPSENLHAARPFSSARRDPGQQEAAQRLKEGRQS